MVSARRTIEETRLLLLETGAGMLESGSHVTVGAVELIDVCRAAGLTSTGSAYKIWATQDAFRVDLLRHVLIESTPDRGAIDRLRAIVSADASELPPLDEFIRDAAGVAAEGWASGANSYAVYLALWLASDEDAFLSRWVHDSDIEILDAFSDLYDTVLDAYDLEWKPPYDAKLFTTMVSALSEGMTVREQATPAPFAREMLRPTGETRQLRPWSLLASGIYALTLASTGPRRPAETAGDDTPCEDR